MGGFEEGKGKAKEALGDVTDDPKLRREGEAQAEKGQAEREATEAHEVDQEAAERAK